MGAVAVCLVITGYLNEERDYPLAGLVAIGIVGLTFIAIGLFAKPRTVESAAKGI